MPAGSYPAAQGATEEPMKRGLVFGVSAVVELESAKWVWWHDWQTTLPSTLRLTGVCVLLSLSLTGGAGW